MTGGGCVGEVGNDDDNDDDNDGGAVNVVKWKKQSLFTSHKLLSLCISLT